MAFSVFQFTASYEADPTSISEYYSYRYLSIHSLIRGWPWNEVWRWRCTYLSIHSLIRGWPWNHICNAGKFTSFNSQPHTRLTPYLYHQYLHYELFQFTASYEADPRYEPSAERGYYSFNSQPHTRLTRQKFIVFYFLLPYFLTDPLNLPLYLKLSFLKCI